MKTFLYRTRRHGLTVERVEVVETAPNYVRVARGRREAWRTVHHEYHTEYVEAKRVLLFDLRAKSGVKFAELNRLNQAIDLLADQKETDFNL